MFGSDWPVCLLAVEYQQQLTIIEAYISEFSVEDKNKIIGGNANKFYNLIS
jgi:L-fuconolactonase